jgi:hypothetical protein
VHWGRVEAREIGPEWWDGGEADELRRRLFPEDDEPDVDEEGDPTPFGALRLVYGWVEEQGPGVALYTTVRAQCPPDAAGVEIHLRSNGRYLRASHKRFGDRHRDLTLTPEPVVGDRVTICTFLPYLAIPDDSPRELAIEIQALEDGDPIEEQLWHLLLPSVVERYSAGPLGALADGARFLGGVDLLDPLCRWFSLDDLGRKAAERCLSVPFADDADEVASKVRSTVAPDMMPRVLGWFDRISRDPRRLAALWERLSSERTPIDPDVAVDLCELGLPPGTSWDRVREAWLRLVKENHPDRANAANRDAATERMARINAAYDRISRRVRK